MIPQSNIFNEEYLSKFRKLLNEPFFLKDPILFRTFIKSLPPKEAYFYFPKGDEIIIYNKKKPEKALRRIHINVPYTEQEEKWLIEFKKIIQSHPENLSQFPSYWNDGLNLSYIYSTKCKLDKAYTRLINYFKWYKKQFPMNIQPEDKVVKLLNSGFVYIFGRDHQFRPIIICQPYQYIIHEKDYSDTDVVTASIFICEYMNNYMLIPGQIENWIMFINLKDVSIFSIPDPMKKLIQTLSEYFIAKLYKSYILGLNAILRLLFNIMCKFLEETTVKKFVILKGKDDPNLFLDISPENLEQRLGGRADNCEYDQPHSLFPPRMPSQFFFKEGEDPNQILITEEEYIKKYKEGKIPKQSVSPFILEKLRIEEIDRKKRELIEKRKNEALMLEKNSKSRKELNLNTSWIEQKESFDMDKFYCCSNDDFFEAFGNIMKMKDNLNNNIDILQRKSINDNSINLKKIQY